MRMRQLGTTQSIAFIAPPEVHQSILDVCKQGATAHLDSSHVVTWLLDQTCTNIQELQPLYFSQGIDFCRRTQAAATWNRFLTDSEHQDAYLKVLQQPERQDLEQLYAPEQSSGSNYVTETTPKEFDWELRTFYKELLQRQRWSQHFNSARSSALEEVEQEREVAFEVEEEREVQRPLRIPALKFPGLHTSIREFATTGQLGSDGGYTKASAVLDKTQLGQKYRIKSSSLLRHLHISNEFFRTVKTTNGVIFDNFTVSQISFIFHNNSNPANSFQRPVNWILWNRLTETAVVIIPEEAELLIPLLRTAKPPRTHLLTYATPVTRRMLHFNRLDYHATPSLPLAWRPPSWLSFELGILAGRLYFDYPEYDLILQNLQCDASSHISENGGGGYNQVTSTTKKTIAFLGEWLSIRRQGQDITHTPMGYVCQGWPLRSDHPFFIQRIVDHQQATSGPSFQAHDQVADEDDEYFDSEDEDEGFVGGHGDGDIDADGDLGMDMDGENE